MDEKVLIGLWAIFENRGPATWGSIFEEASLTDQTLLIMSLELFFAPVATKPSEYMKKGRLEIL